MHQTWEILKHLFDAAAFGTGVAYFFSVALPGISAILSLIWLSYRIVDIHLAVKLKRKQLKEIE